MQCTDYFSETNGKILRGLPRKTCHLHLDDIFVMGKTFKEHLKNLREVFQKLRDANLVLSPIKCHLCQIKVRYLDHIINRDGIAKDPNKVQEI